ncbi:unnamed protein product [Owenia fusiformis]|uniref:Uncharacterized protein n=1 Tax=Owenia fusiformis TaxID=6347 RepID=A0A8J1V036_OWEFU|nr:unnamed protein product [Owenia fusiformis]
MIQWEEMIYSGIPPEQFQTLTSILDGGVRGQNWRALIANIPGNIYKDYEVEEFARELHQGKSPTDRLLHDLSSRLYTVKDLAQFLKSMKHYRALELLDYYEPPRIVKNMPETLVGTEDRTVRLCCQVTAVPPPNFQWFKAKQLIDGATSETLIIENLKQTDAGSYICRIDNGKRETVIFSKWCKLKMSPPSDEILNSYEDAGCQNNPVVILENSDSPLPTMLSQAPVITQQPKSQTVYMTHPFNLICQATGSPPISYKWYKDGHLLVDELTCQLKRNEARAEDNGLYHCDVSNTIGLTTSREAQISIEYQPGQMGLPQIYKHPDPKSISIGDKAYFSCKARGAEPLRYQWFKAGSHDNKMLIGYTDPDICIPIESEDQEGRYYCEVSNDKFGRVHSDQAILRVLPSKQFTAIDKVALLIGNLYYRNGRQLTAPKFDITTMRNLLEKQNFRVTSYLNLTLTEMVNAIRHFCSTLGKGVYCVFYFVGHGFETGGQCFLAPSDVRMNYTSVDCVCSSWILHLIQHDIRNAPALNVFFLDICRERHDSGIDEILPEYDVKKTGNMYIFYATSKGYKAYEHKGRETPLGKTLPAGIFVENLEMAMTKPRSLDDIYRKLQEGIAKDQSCRNIMFPEVTKDLSQRRTLWDPICKSEDLQTHFSRLSLIQQFKDMHQPPDILCCTLPDVGVEIQVKCTSPVLFSNVLEIIVDTHDTPDASNCRSWVTDVPVHVSVEGGESTVLYHPPHSVTITCINDIQKLKGDLNIGVMVTYVNRNGETKEIKVPMNLGRPLVSVLELWRNGEEQIKEQVGGGQQAVENDEHNLMPAVSLLSDALNKQSL